MNQKKQIIDIIGQEKECDKKIRFLDHTWTHLKAKRNKSGKVTSVEAYRWEGVIGEVKIQHTKIDPTQEVEIVH